MIRPKGVKRPGDLSASKFYGQMLEHVVCLFVLLICFIIAFIEVLK